MTYKIAIRKNATGETRIAEMPYDWDKGDGYTDMFWWSEGDFCCDCNRYLVFERAGGHEPTDEEDELYGGCGHTAYSVLYAEMEDGSRIEIDPTLAPREPLHGPSELQAQRADKP